MNAPTATKRKPSAPSELKPDHQIRVGERDAQREVAAPHHSEVRAALLDDLARHVDVLALDAPAVAHPVALLEHALRADPARERVREPALARDHDHEPPAGPEQPVDLGQG